jgi:hypothetical protein
MADTANIVEPPITGSLSIEGSSNDAIEIIESREQERDLADPISEDDGINPDDAPEVGLGDIDEEVRAITR